MKGSDLRSTNENHSNRNTFAQQRHGKGPITCCSMPSSFGKLSLDSPATILNMDWFAGQTMARPVIELSADRYFGVRKRHRSI